MMSIDIVRRVVIDDIREAVVAPLQRAVRDGIRRDMEAAAVGYRDVVRSTCRQLHDAAIERLRLESSEALRSAICETYSRGSR
jgi:hypothetical protein